MNRRSRVLVITFIEAFSGLLLERGVYFYTFTLFGWERVPNLALALAFGLIAMIGALSSHRLTVLTSEKFVLVGSIAVRLAIYVLLSIWPTAPLIVVGFLLLGLMNGMKWPVVESYIAAGTASRETSRMLGRFCVTWSAASPLAVAVSGPLTGLSEAAVGGIASWLFILPAVLTAANLLLTRPLRSSPIHLENDHPDRPKAAHLPKLKALLAGHRWMMLLSCACVYVIGALQPDIFQDRLGWRVSIATSLAAALDVARVATFALLWKWHGWHGRTGLLALAIVLLPAGFFSILFLPTTPLVVAGEVLFGFAFGTVYFGSIYYGMVVKNAAVDAGGAHESVICLGFALGPAFVLSGLALAPHIGGDVLGIIAGIGPMTVLCLTSAIRNVFRAARPTDSEEAAS